MARIRILDEVLSNRIAAGEVVERPASVVKELVENAIDAGASRVEVSVQDAGMTLIKVVDNGCGMDDEDAKLAFERHATSKLSADRDLFRIRTLGFRGEALPSIASVSKIMLRTRVAEANGGTSVTVEGGRLVSVQPAASHVGTEVVVSDLFFNTPARLKYIKSLSTEMGHIAEAVTREALAHPEISFHLSSDGRTVQRTPGDGNLLHVISAVFGADTTKLMVPVSWRNQDYTINGWIGKPELTRANRSHMYFTVNGRTVKSIGLAAGVIRAYQTKLPVHRYPVCFLDIRMDPTLVDVNVHPSKTEVRFSEEKELAYFLETAILQSLRTAVAIPEPKLTKTKEDEVRTTQLAWNTRDANTKTQLPARVWDRNEAVKVHEGSNNPIYAERSLDVQRPVTTDVLTEPPSQQEPTAQAVTDQTFDGWSANSAPVFRPVAQVLGMYVVAEDETGIYLIDQHAAHEKILYEKFTERLLKTGIRPMPLLVPVSLEYTPGESQTLQQYLPVLEEAGIVLEAFGPHSYLVRSVPDIWEGLEPQSLLHDLIDLLLEQGRVDDPRAFISKNVITKACKAAIKANTWLSMPEMQALCEQLSALNDPYTCPHGRPIIIHITRYELEKHFKRVM